MKVISPVDSLDETEALLANGADELYGGYLPDDWRKRYGRLTSINQRTFAQAQIASRADLTAIVERAHGAGARFSLTLNSPFYSDEQLPLLLDYVAEAVAANIDDIILADLGLLRVLRRHWPALEYHASTLAHLSNSAAVAYYAAAGIDRTILPRHLTVAEMGEIVAALPLMRCDAFLLVGKCPNTEGLCTFHHASPDQVWPCEIPYAIAPLAEPVSPALERAMTRQRSWATSNRRHGCGLCAVPRLLDLGIHGVKLVGRGAPKAQKLANLQLVREFIALAVSCPDFATYRQQARRAHRRRFGTPCSPNVCYYPEFYQSE